MGVLRQIAVAKNRPVRLADQYLDTVWLSPARELGLVHAALEPGEQVVRAPRVPVPAKRLGEGHGGEVFHARIFRCRPSRCSGRSRSWLRNSVRTRRA